MSAPWRGASVSRLPLRQGFTIDNPNATGPARAGIVQLINASTTLRVRRTTQ